MSPLEDFLTTFLLGLRILQSYVGLRWQISESDDERGNIPTLFVVKIRSPIKNPLTEGQGIM